MTASSALRRALSALGLLLLALLGWLGVSEGLKQLITEPLSPMQWVQSASALAFGILAVAAIAAVLRRHRWRTRVLGAWAAALTVSAGLAPMAWADTGPTSALAGGAGTLLIALGIIWMVRGGLGPESRVQSPQSRGPGRPSDAN